MIVEYARRAILDLDGISNYYLSVADKRTATKFAARFQVVIERIARRPDSARPVMERNGVRVVPLITFPYIVFYRVISPDRLRVLHVRHTARLPWV